MLKFVLLVCGLWNISVASASQDIYKLMSVDKTKAEKIALKEKSQVIEGNLETLCSIGKDGKTIYIYMLKDINGNRTEVFFDKDIKIPEPGTKIKINKAYGIKNNKNKIRAFLAKDVIKLTGFSEEVMPYNGVGEKKVLTYLINYADKPEGNKATLAQYENINADMKKLFWEQSYNKMTFNGTIFNEYITVPQKSTDACDSNFLYGMITAAQEYVKNKGLDPKAFEHHQFVLPSTNGCGWCGLGSVRGPYTWINACNSYNVTAHEIGHNLGALHANRYEKCDANYKNCTNIEYGDGASIMGTAPGEFTGVHKEKLEWNTAQLIDKTGEYELYPIEINNSQARSLKIKRANNEFYFVEYRQPINFDTKISSKYFTSVGIHYSDASTASWRLKDLTVGQEFNDPSLNLTIKPIAISSTTAKILVAFGNIPPTATPSPTVVPPTKTPTVVPPTKTPTVTPTATPTVPPPTNVQFFIAPKYQEYKYEPTRTLWSSVDVVVKKNDKPLNKVVVDYEIINSDNKSMRKLTRATNTDGYVKFGLPIDKYMLPGKYRIKVQAKIEKKIISAPLVEFSVIE